MPTVCLLCAVVTEGHCVAGADVCTDDGAETVAEDSTEAAGSEFYVATIDVASGEAAGVDLSVLADCVDSSVVCAGCSSGCGSSC